MLGRAGQPAIPTTAGTLAFYLAALAAMQPPSVPPIQHEIAHIPCTVLGPSCARSCRQTDGWHYG
eukprot:7457269-Pyramimonas_sp.AAC.1